MTDSALERPARPTWLFWTISGLSLLWNAFGCMDFAMTVTRYPAYVAQFPPETIDWLDTAPTWTLVPWAMGVGGALAGSALLLLRSRHAAGAFLISLIGLAVTQAWQIAAGVPPGMSTPSALGMTALVWIIAMGLLWYAMRMRSRGVLRAR